MRITRQRGCERWKKVMLDFTQKKKNFPISSYAHYVKIKDIVINVGIWNAKQFVQYVMTWRMNRGVFSDDPRPAAPTEV
jgi:hypothetical protein